MNVRFVKPIDYELIDELAVDHNIICTMEENIQVGGFGNQVGAYLNDKNEEVALINVSIKDEFVEHGDIASLRRKLGLDSESVVKRILDILD